MAETTAPDLATQKALTYWQGQIQSAQKREKAFRKDAREVVSIYEGVREDAIPFNILYSNTETLAPALYNTTPRPVVQRRFKSEDPLGKAGADVMTRLLEFYMDSGDSGENDFDALMKSATLEGLVPGRGVSRFKYEATIEKQEVPTPPPQPAEGAAPDAEPPEKVTYECVEGEDIPWDRVLFGYAKRWKDVPWIAIEHFFTETEAVENFGEVASTWEYVDNSKFTGDEEEGKSETQDDAEGSQKTLHTFEIWNKADKKVRFYAPAVTDRFLKGPIPDPLGLQGFWPIPKPMCFMQKISELTPVPLYKLYKAQAEELNRISVRIMKLIKMLKVAGMYDANVDSIAKALEAEDGILEPIQNSAAMSAGNGGGGLDKAIWLIPIEKISTVIQGLYLQRQQCKQIIYEITGVSDILRGSSVASETATAQNIKNQWGTLRLKRWQKEVMRYVRESLRIMGEIAVTKLSQETIMKMTGLPYPTAEQKAQAQMAFQQFQMLTQQAQQAGQPPPAPPPGADKVQEALQSPTWEDILAMLKDDLVRNYKVDIETNSTVDTDATEDKQDISDLLNAMSQFMAGVAPLVENGSMPFEAAQAMLMMIVRRFRLGSEVEDALKKMKPPQPPQEDQSKVEAEKVKMETVKVQGEVAKMQASADVEKVKGGIEADKIAAQLKIQELNAEMAFKREEHAMKMKELGMKMEQAAASHDQKMVQIRTPKPAPKPAQNTTQ
jgi:hypothetical protein